MMSNAMVLAIGGGAALCLVGLAFVGWQGWRRRQKLAGSAAYGRATNNQAAMETALPPPPRPDKIGPTEQLVDVLALVGNALVLNNGTFVRMIEAAPVDLEGADPSLKQKFWLRFTDALRSIRAPLGLQIVVTTRPQDITVYLARWEEAAREWQRRAEASPEPDDGDRRRRMAAGALETGAFLMAAHERLLPMGQRYLVVVSHNPFPEAQTTKTQTHVLNPTLTAEALTQLEENVQLVWAALSKLGLPLVDLDPAAMCLALWEHYHHPPNVLGGGLAPRAMLEELSAPSGAGGSMDTLAHDYLHQRPAPEAFLAAARDPARLADLIAPAMIDEQPTYIRVGDVIGRGYTLYDFDPRGVVDLSSLLAFSADMTHSLFLWPADPVSIRQQLKERETELKSSQLVDAERGAVTDWGRQSAIQTAESLRADLEIAMQAPFFLHWFGMVWANDLPSLEKKCQQFETRLKVMDIRFHRATRVQLGVFQSARPLARMSYRLRPRNMSAESLGPFFPFARREYFDPAGWHFGLHRGNGTIVCLDPFQEGKNNASELILGTPGGGKSVYLKQTIETLLALGHRVFVMDPEREYLRLAVDHHAPYFELGRRGAAPRIPLRPELPDGWVAGLVEVGEIYEALSARPLTAEQAEVLADHYQQTLAEAGVFFNQPDSWQRELPLLIRLAERLKSDPNGRELGRVLAYAADSLAGGHQINILDINLDSDEPWIAAAQSLAAFIEVILSRALQAAEFNALVRCYQTTMEKWGLRADDPQTWKRRAPTLSAPTLSALADVLASDIAPESRHLAAVLEQYAHGLYSGLFNCQTTVDLRNAQLVVFGMRSLRENVEKSLAPVFAWQVLQLVWNAVVAGGAAQPIHLFIDEAWYILEQPGAAARLERMARSFRKHYAALHLATQEIKKLIRSPEAEAIANIGGLTMLFGQETEAAARALGGVFGLSEAEQAGLLRAGKGEGLLLAGSHVRLPLYVAVNPMRLQYLSTNVAQQRAVARASGRRAEPVL
jgi:hypothetical protein